MKDGGARSCRSFANYTSEEHSDPIAVVTYRLWIFEMFLIKFTLTASAALLCALFAIAPMFGPLRAESTQAATNAGILRAMATRGAIHAILDDGTRIQ